MAESWADQVARLESMSRDEKWDLSENDRAAIRPALGLLARPDGMPDVNGEQPATGRQCPTCGGSGRVENPPLVAVAVEGGPRCDYRIGIGMRCEMTPHGRAYPHRVTSPPITIEE